MPFGPELEEGKDILRMSKKGQTATAILEEQAEQFLEKNLNRVKVECE